MTKAHPTTGTLRLAPKPPKTVPVAQPAARPAVAATPAPAKRPNAKPRQRPVTALRTKPPAALQSAEPQTPVQTDTGDRLAKRVAAMVPCSRPMEAAKARCVSFAPRAAPSASNSSASVPAASPPCWWSAAGRWSATVAS